MKKYFNYLLLMLFILVAVSFARSFLTGNAKDAMSAEEFAFGSNSVDAFRSKGFAAVKDSLGFDLSEPQFLELQDFLKDAVDESHAPVAVGKTEAGKDHELHLEYRTPRQTYLLVDVTFNEATQKITGFHMLPLEFSVLQNNWNFAEKGPIHLLVLATGFFLFLLNCYLVYRVAQQPRSKWWAPALILSLWGFPSLRFHWTLGQFGFFPADINFLSFGVLKLPWYDPWIVVMSFPAGALIALHLLKNHTRSLEATDSTATLPDATPVGTSPVPPSV